MASQSCPRCDKACDNPNERGFYRCASCQISFQISEDGNTGIVPETDWKAAYIDAENRISHLLAEIERLKAERNSGPK